MKRVSTEDLRELEVVNVCTGEKIGYPSDFEFDLEDGKILSLIVPICDGFSLFGKREKCIIPWCKIECIGEDTILVRLSASEISCCNPKKQKKKR